MGFGLAELRLIDALRRQPGDIDIAAYSVGGRAGRRYARSINGRWVPAVPGRLGFTTAATGGRLLHLTGLDVRPPSRRRFVVSIQDVAPLRFDDEGSLPPWAGSLARRAAR